MWKMLKHIGQTHRRKLITTFSLVGLDVGKRCVVYTTG